MANSNTACPVCTLFLREGVTLQAHLDTHPKEQVIEALMRVSSGATNEVPNAQKSPTFASSGSAFTPVQSGLNSNSFLSQSPQALLSINPPSHMTTAVTYQHFMSSNGSTVLPQYIQVPTIVNPCSNIPLFPNSPNLVPNPSVNYSQTAYNPLYNPYIPQPYPFSQPVFTGFPLSGFPPPISESQNVNLNLSSSSAETAEHQATVVKKCSVATSTEPGRTGVKAKDRKTFLKHAANRRKVKVLKQKLCESNRLLWKIRSRFAPIRPALVKVLKQKIAPASSTHSRIMSPPPLTPITEVTNNSISDSNNISPPPLSKAPCFDKLNVDKGEDVTDSAAPNHRSDNHEIDFMDCHSKSNPVNEYSESVILCSNIEIEEDSKEQEKGVIKVLEKHIEHKEVEGESISECPQCPLLVDPGEKVKGSSESEEVEDEEMNEKRRKIFQVVDVMEDSKIDVTSVPLNHDIPKEISSHNIERNCDGSDIFIQQENILLNENSDKEKTNDNLYPEFVQIEVVEPGKRQLEKEKNQSEYSFYHQEASEGVDYANKKQPTPQPVTYTDLQPAKSSKVYQDLGISPYLNFNNYMEVDGIKIFFNNSSSNVPFDPVVKRVTCVQNNAKNLSAVTKTENQKSNQSIAESVIHIAPADREFKGDTAFRENHKATTSQTNDVQLDLPDTSPMALNIQADESMPARGELSEQESLGAENSTWNLFRGNTMADTKTLEDWRSANLAVSVIGDKKLAKSFKCSTCNEVFSCPKERRVHKNTVHLSKTEKGEKVSSAKKHKTYACNFCSDVFVSLKDRKVHMYQIHQSESKEKRNEIKEENAEALSGTTVKNEAAQENNVKTEQAAPLPDANADPVKYCLRCSLPFMGAKKLREHMRLVHGEVRFKCESCSACFDEESEYNDHLVVHPLTCDKCGKTFHKKPNLKLHMKRHLDVKPYECSLCPKSFITRQKLEEHMNSHSGKKPIKCTLCDKMFSRHSNLIQHKNLHHFNLKKKTKDFVCRCGEVFHSMRKLEWHKEVHEPKPKPCPYCSQKFIHSASVTRHIRRAHLPEYLPGDNREFDNVQCPICEKVYLRSSLAVHMRVHNGEKPFACKICDKRFSTKWNLELHNWTHQSRSNMPFKCTVCKSAFFRESDFVAHMNSHRNYKPFTCNICGQKFIRKYSCLRHQEEHKKSKQYVCGVNGCAKSFHRGYYLRDHMKVHTGVRPHTCHICGKASSTKSNHNKHVRIHDTREPINTEN